MATRKRILPGLTKTQALRQARSATLVKEFERKEEMARQPQPALLEPGKRRRAYTPAEPKRVDFTRPTMTKTMLARIKHTEKIKQEQERKEQESMPGRRIPKRTPAPIAGDPRW